MVRILTVGCLLACFTTASLSQPPRVFAPGQLPHDSRLDAPRQLNSFFPARSLNGSIDWPTRREQIRQRILVSQGLWPLPERTPLHAVIHGRVERDDYVVDRVFFESIPGHFVTGSLYRPKNPNGPIPAVLCPHGHWKEGRFYQATDSQVQSDLKSGAEDNEITARVPIQARAVQLARMGCMAFIYDMTGNADSVQLNHRPDHWDQLDGKSQWGFASTQAELRLQNMMGLQTWNSIRAIDFLIGLPDTDPSRIGVTGASGGGTQSMVIGAVDDRIAAAMPCVMVSTSMQGGCTCENASHLRIGQGNIDLAAAIAPRPLGLTAADDWTVELKTKGYPDLRRLYTRLENPQNLTAAFHIEFKHNYNRVNRAVMYEFFNRHFKLNLSTPIRERPFRPLARDEATVWTASCPAPSGDDIGDRHEVQLLQAMDRSHQRQMDTLLQSDKDAWKNYQFVVGTGWKVILGMDVFSHETPQAQAGGPRDWHGLTVRPVKLKYAQAELPVLAIESEKTPRRGTFLWLTDQGKAGLFKGDQWRDEVRELSSAGFRILAADLLGQGEFGTSENADTQPMWFQREGKEAWHRFGGYTYGYNLTRFAQRTHDTLALLDYADSIETDASSEVWMIAEGQHAGPVAIAAIGQSDRPVAGAWVDPQGFRFDAPTSQNDAGFVPGSIKYLGMKGLVSLCSGDPLTVVGSDAAIAKTLSGAPAAAGESVKSIRFCRDRGEMWEQIRLGLGHSQ